MERVPSALILEFQSTLSMRRATPSTPARKTSSQFQSTLSMRRATWCEFRAEQFVHISIHALHEESDSWKQLFVSYGANFNPRSP